MERLENELDKDFEIVEMEHDDRMEDSSCKVSGESYKDHGFRLDRAFTIVPKFDEIEIIQF